MRNNNEKNEKNLGVIWPALVGVPNSDNKCTTHG